MTIANVTTEIINTKEAGITLRCLWEGFVTGNTVGNAFVNPNFKDIHFQVKGTFDGATALTQGTNDIEDGTETWKILTDGKGNNVAFTIAGSIRIHETPYKIRAAITNAGASTDLDVTIIASTTARR